MKNIDKWNLIVEQYNQLYNKQEIEVQKIWESYCSELLNYKHLLGEIDSQRNIQIGSSERIIPDIILRKDNNDIFDIELKQYSLGFDDSFEGQLISYLNQTHISVGMIVCKKIYLYVYEYQNRKIDKIVIPFEKDSEDGEKLIELLCKDNFNENDIKSFVINKKKTADNITKIKEELSNDLIEELLNTHFSESYSKGEIDSALSDFDIIVSKKSFVQPSFNPNVINSISSPKQAVNPLNDIGQLAINWCIQKSKEGLIIYDEANTNASHSIVRFTTKIMDKFLPPDDPRNVVWRNRAYFYEIDFRGGHSEKMWIAIKNRNRTDITEKARLICEFGNKAFSPHSDYWTAWNSFSAKQEMIVDQKTMNDYLDKQFESLMQIEKNFFDKIN